jgi:hypothetical protein
MVDREPLMNCYFRYNEFQSFQVLTRNILVRSFELCNPYLGIPISLCSIPDTSRFLTDKAAIRTLTRKGWPTYR